MNEVQFLKFSKKVTIPNESGCMEWTGALSQGYGVMWNGRRNDGAHRLSYEHFIGPIPDGMEIDHLCRNRACVNPQHLEAVTHRINLLRGEGMSAKHAKQAHCKNGHELIGYNVYLYRGERHCRKCRNAAWRRCRPSTHVNNKDKTHCKHGHEFTLENTYYEGTHRHCRECGRRECRRRYWQLKSAGK